MKKKALKIAGAIALTLTFAAAALEWAGYRPFDRKNGDNILCEKDRFCRPLTDGEIALAESVFGETIDYSRVKIFNRPYMITAGANMDTVMAPNGNIYFPPDTIYTDDFSKTGDYQQAAFIHEMTHVWQHYNGTDVQLEAIKEFFKNRFHYDQIYAYDEEIAFEDMNIEQQARLVEDYFQARLREQKCKWACTPEKNAKETLEKRLPPDLKLKPSP